MNIVLAATHRKGQYMKFGWMKNKLFIVCVAIAALLLSFCWGRTVGTGEERVRHTEEAEAYCINSLKYTAESFDIWIRTRDDVSYRKGVAYFSNFAGTYENLMRKENGQSDLLHVTEYYAFLSVLQNYEAECQERMDAICEAITAVIEDLYNVNNHRAFRTIIEEIKPEM